MRNRFATSIGLGIVIGTLLGISINNTLLGIWIGIIFVFTLSILAGSSEPKNNFFK